MVELAILHVEQNPAAVVTAGGRILVSTGDGELALLPREFPLVVGFTVDAVKEFLIVSHCSSLSSP